jgi:2-keto-3-deoxy-6-phosphogluconate aldolase
MDPTLNEMTPWAPQSWPAGLPLLVTLPGLRAQDAARTGVALYAAGFRVMAVPWAGLATLATLQQLVRALPADCVVGTTGVNDASQLLDVAHVGGRLVVAQAFEPELLLLGLRLRLFVVPHVYSLQEALQAMGSGAQAVRLHLTGDITRRALMDFEPFLPEGVEIWPAGNCPLDVLPLRFAVDHHVYRPDQPDAASQRLAAFGVANWTRARTAMEAAMPRFPLKARPGEASGAGLED